jgi:hypothetical protein
MDNISARPEQGKLIRGKPPSDKLTLADIDRLTRGRLGEFRVPCPLCSSHRKRRNQRKKVFRIWRDEPGFARFSCIHCGEHGWVGDEHAAPLDPGKLARQRADAAQRERDAIAERRCTARRLWERHRPVAGSIVERYLREARRCDGPFPPTLGYLPPRGEHLPAMIAAFGFVSEPEPGKIAIADGAVRGVHITNLKSDGSGKADFDPNKITVGLSFVAPIVLAPVNDLLGLAITEGVEDGLSVVHTGLGVWAAGSHVRMPALADVVPDYVECVTIYAHDDDGRSNALALARALDQRGNIEVLVEGLAP